ncbi:MAG: hypothetical protein AABY34_00440 [Pseudomonadota bacterium]
MDDDFDMGIWDDFVEFDPDDLIEISATKQRQAKARLGILQARKAVEELMNNRDYKENYDELFED